MNRELLEHAVDAARKNHDVMPYLSHLLEDVGSTSRMQHILAFLQELALQVRPADWTDAINDGGDALQGLGWILRSCREALAIHDELMHDRDTSLGQVRSLHQ